MLRRRTPSRRFLAALLATAACLPGPTIAAESSVSGASADLSITIGNGSDEIETGQLTTYQIVAASSGPEPMSATVAVDFPFGLSNCNWTCAGDGGASCAAAGSGDIGEGVFLPTALSRASFSATCFVATSIPIPPPPTLAVTASVVGVVSDPNPLNNIATDTDALVPVVDVKVSIDDGLSTIWYGRSLTYVIKVSSQGSDAIVRLVNSVPSTLTDCTWSCQSFVGEFCPTPASGNGNIDVQLVLPANSGGFTEFARFSSTCMLSGSAFLDVVNTAELLIAPPFRDPVPSNNQATDTDLLRRSVDLSATIDDGVQYVRIGDFLDYTIRIDNAGPDSGEFTYIFDALPNGLSSGVWSCTASPGATCHEGVGNTLDDVVTIPVGGHVTYLFSAIVQGPSFTAPIANTVSAFSDLETFDPTPGNNVVTDRDIVVLFRADFDFP
ncbi:hypothetical protein [Dokdonella sp.]|uniref:hypothetical protein n=1 Tax=Dokdonella sp. TaxID=2291710 RepID=UPI0035292F5E